MMWKIILPVLAAVFALETASMVGGWREANANDEGVQNALNFAIGQHNKQSNDKYISQVAQVFKAESQVVSGLRYRISVQMGKTPCQKNGASEGCAIHEDPEKAQLHNCTFTVWSQPWLQKVVLQKTEGC